jgi:type I restriction enzyme M protein
LEYQEGKNQNKLRDEDIQKIIDVYDAYQDVTIPARKPYKKGYAKVVSMDEIQENDYNLNIRRYADTSPPPELFDTKAVLNGGIPISEVEDEYIQWILQGADVSKVFVRRDNEYYDFKPEIETKEQIGDNLDGADQSVIIQFERWWDKYRVSLQEIDVLAKDSEEVMRGFLKELGYE